MGWTDEEMYDQSCFDVQVRYALGYHQLGERYFSMRTLYAFRERLSRYMQETGKNLLDEAFEQVTDEQLEAYELKTGKQCMAFALRILKQSTEWIAMDSTQVVSNIPATWEGAIWSHSDPAREPNDFRS
jgi:hypothetical protein